MGKLRFRYECEGRGAGALQGATSSSEKKTFPKIQIRGYSGPAVVVVSCVTHDSDKPKAHPHMLVSPASVGRDGCKKGVCTQHVSSSDMTVEFQHLGIQCKRKRDIQKALDERKSIRVDPFRQGFEHANSPGNIDLNAVRLCFQAFLENPETPGKFTRVVPPVCSKPIFDAKAKKELQIMDMSGNTSPAEGGKKLIILCERVSRDDIKVRFFQDSTGWEAYGEFKPEDVHKQYAISLSVPPYMDGNISENQQVWIELTKADGSTSEPTEFIYTPGGQVADRVGGPKQVELSRRVEPVPSPQSKPVNMYNGGSVTNIKSERKIKVERAEAETSWAAMVNGVNQTQGPAEHRGGAAAAAKIRWQEIGQGSGTGVGLQRGSKADGAPAVEHAAHAEHQQHVVDGGREVHQRRLARPLSCPQELPRGQPAVKKSLRVG